MIYEYNAQVAYVVDGDTYDLIVDCGFRISREIRVRLRGVDTHEIYGTSSESEEHQQGERERAFVTKWFDDGTFRHDGEWPFVVRTYKDATGKYGRYLVDIERQVDEADLRYDLLDAFPDVESTE